MTDGLASAGLDIDAFLDALARRAGGRTGIRASVVVAHPDDEVIGAGARLAWLGSGTDLIHVTDGAPRSAGQLAEHGFERWQDYALARRQELERALMLAGFSGSREALGIPDQQACRRLADLARYLAHRLSRSDIVLTHPYEGGHPDHDSAAFGVHAGCALLRRIGRNAPAIVEMASYNAAAGSFVAGSFLSAHGAPVTRVALRPAEQDLKRRLFACFATQAKVLRRFGIEEERYRQAPSYDFTAPPHDGAVYYERFEWDIDAARFTALAAAALTTLGLGAKP